MRRRLFVPMPAAARTLEACARLVPDTVGATADRPGEAADLVLTVPTLDGAAVDGHSLADKPAELRAGAPWCPTRAPPAVASGAARRIRSPADT